MALPRGTGWGFGKAGRARATWSCAGTLLALLLLAEAKPAAAQETIPTASETAASITRYGVGVRMPRWVSVPGWFL
ncbi:MAG TPA: hypothetical protein VGG33_18410, partial [Polyangia bacterium]